MSFTRLLLVAALALAGCNVTTNTPTPLPVPVEPPSPPSPGPTPVDDCEGLEPLALTVRPLTIRVGAPALLTAKGGSGKYTFGVVAGGSGGEVQGARFTAGNTPASDTLFVTDQACASRAEAGLTVVGPFDVAPTRSRLKPLTSINLRVEGTVGTPAFELVQRGSDGTGDVNGARPKVTAAGRYTAGTRAGIDLITVTDPATGDVAELVLEISSSASFRASPSRLALPAGGSLPLRTADGSGVVTWRLKAGQGQLTQDAAGARLAVGPDDSGFVQLVAKDSFTDEEAPLSVRILDELFHKATAVGRGTDFGVVVTGDFDGDKIPDVAVSLPDSDVGRASGGAVFVFKGSAAGLPSTPTWTITGPTDTAQLGATMVAGDLDGDGKDDLAVSSPGADITGTDSGAVFLYRFDAAGPSLLRGPLTGLPRANFGAALALVDVNGDGQKDLLVGSPGGDLANTALLKTRGIVDVYLIGKGKPVGDLGSLRLSGADLNPDGTVVSRSNTASGKQLVAADFNGDGKIDLAFLGAVTNNATTGAPVARSVPAVQIHLSRSDSKLFEEKPDAYLIPYDPADAAEGTYRLAFVPKQDNQPALLAVVIDGADSPDLSGTAQNRSGTNSGGALLFDLSRLSALLPPPATPRQFGRLDAFARIYGEAGNSNAGRSFALLDVDGKPGLELLLGAPNATGLAADNTTALPGAGKLLAFPISEYAAGTVVNKPSLTLSGVKSYEGAGCGLAAWNLTPTQLVTLSARASTSTSKYTGRLDAFAGFDRSLRTSAELPAKPGQEQFGLRVAVARVGSKPFAAVGAPFTYLDNPSKSGTERAGVAFGFDAQAPTVTPLAISGGASPLSLGGRETGADVAFTDFNGDGRMDLLIGAPNHAALNQNAAASELAAYSKTVPACMPATAATTPGGVQVHLQQGDGTFKPTYRIWAPVDIAGCSAPATCLRSGIGRTLVGGFDFDGDNLDDVAAARAGGAEIFLGRANDPSLTGMTMICDSALSLALPSAAFPGGTITALAGLGDLDGDRCDEIAFRYSGNGKTGVAIAFGFDRTGTRCAGHTVPAVLRISADAEVGLNVGSFGVAAARHGGLVAIGSTSHPVAGLLQPAVLLYTVAELAALRPASGERVIAAYGDPSLTQRYLLAPNRAPGFGAAIVGGLDLDRDGKLDLIVGAPGATEASDGGGAVYVVAGGQTNTTPEVLLMLVGEGVERSSFGQSLSFIPATASTPAELVVGAPKSFRTGTQNGTAFALPLSF